MNGKMRQVRCDGASRRDFLRVGTLAPLGLTLGSLKLRGSNQAKPRAKSCILIWLDGGPSHLETFDLKPGVPQDVRGPFQPIHTAVPGMDLCEHLPKTAQGAKRFSLIRSMTSPLGEHGLANHYLLTGYKPSPVLEYPGFGSVLAKVRQEKSDLPANVAIPEWRNIGGAGFLGTEFAPFTTGGDPGKAEFRVRDLDPFPKVTAKRLARRREFLQEFDKVRAGIEKNAPSDPAFEQAYRLVTSPTARRAFDLGEEKDVVRASYGSRLIGQGCLLARRLVERGVPFVTVMNTGWDTHNNLTLQLRDGYAGAKTGVGLIPSLDLAFSSLLEDLHQRGLLEQTLVVVMGEFGRTPKVNIAGGRDHWPRVFSVAMAGGGVRGGQVIGSSDRVGESPQDQPVTPADLAFTIYTLLGVDPRLEMHTADGRPIQVNREGSLIPGLV
ncbi:MAG: DUF1501 domain-containing protein [Gemmataceae bacterium]|nr:DUF1501 domain-containing protein [Gemmataceae bacterium]